MSETIEITRYPNRRLYDRSQKKYVTLGDIESLVLEGKDVLVRDSKSEEDLTGTILTQILLERHPERMKVFSAPFLHALLRADQMAIDWLTVYFGQAMNVMKGTSGMPTSGLPGMDIWTSMMPGAMGGASGSSATHDESAQAKSPDSDDEQQDLKEKLAEMERRLRQLEEGE